MKKSVIEKISDEDLIKLISTSDSKSDVFVKLNMRKSGSSFFIFNRRIKDSNIDISHFKSSSLQGKRLPDDKIYIENSPHRNIRDRVISDNFMEYRCVKCFNNAIWQSELLILELDHINGKRNDNRKTNLRWLCPNCHSQTKTFGNKLR